MSVQPTPEETGRGPPAERRSSVGVITVDNQAAFRRGMRAVIDTTEGFEQVAEAASGKEALALVERYRPDLALVDVRMPGLNGFETARLIADSGAGTIVVLISAVSCPKGAIASSGAVAFVPKEELSPSLLQALWRKHGRRPPGKR